MLCGKCYTINKETEKLLSTKQFLAMLYICKTETTHAGSMSSTHVIVDDGITSDIVERAFSENTRF